jgi:hypothetical protein
LNAERPGGGTPPPPARLPSYAYLLVGWRQFWPALLEETRRLPEKRLRRSEARVLVYGLMLCIIAGAMLPGSIADLHARWAWQPLPATIVSAQPAGGKRQGACFNLRLDVEAWGRVVPTVTTTSHPHCLRRSWSDPPRQPQPGERITVRADPADPRRVIPDSALLNVGQHVAAIFFTILAIVPTALALIGHRAARLVRREREARD